MSSNKKSSLAFMKNSRHRLKIAILASAFLAMALPTSAQFEPGAVGSGDSLFSGGMGGGESVVSIESQFTTPKDKTPGYLFITATIKPGWHIYSITQPPGGPIATEIKLTPAQGVRVLGQFQPTVEPEKKREPVFDNIMVESHHDKITWYAPLEWAPGVDPSKLKIEGEITVQPCDADSCLPPTQLPFSAALGVGVEIPQQSSGVSQTPGAEPRFAPEQLQAQEVVEARSLFVALLFAFGGGLILNVMPCVLPVIGLKILSFFQQAGQNRARAFILNLWYSLGLLFVFLVLAALGVGLSEMFTAELFGIIMVAVVFTMALSLMGVWEFEMPSLLGTGKIQAITQEEGALGAFFKGIITTLLAIPCGAPLLSPALKWSDEQVRAGSPASVYLMFAVIGLGMAFPYLVIGAFPELLRFLPKPGAWMDTFKKAMGYCLLIAVVWILYFIPLQDVVPTVGLLFGLWLACWLVGRVPLTAPRSTKVRAWLAAIAAVVASAAFCFLFLRPAMQERLNKYVGREIYSGHYDDAVRARMQIAAPTATIDENTTTAPDLEKAELPWQPFSRDQFERYVADEKTVLVDFTADWCLTCKTLEALVLNTRRTRELVDHNGVVTLQADWTNREPEVTEMLEILGGKQVPVVAIFPAGNPNRPIILRGGYTQQTLLDALQKAGSSKQR